MVIEGKSTLPHHGPKQGSEQPCLLREQRGQHSPRETGLSVWNRKHGASKCGCER